MSKIQITLTEREGRLLRNSLLTEKRRILNWANRKNTTLVPSAAAVWMSELDRIRDKVIAAQSELEGKSDADTV